MTLIGLCRQPFHVDDYLNDIVFKSITLHTVHGRRIFETWENCEKLVAEGMYISFGQCTQLGPSLVRNPKEICDCYLYFANFKQDELYNIIFCLHSLGKVKPSLIVSHQFNMSDYQNAFGVLMSGNGCKIVVDPQNRLCPK